VKRSLLLLVCLAACNPEVERARRALESPDPIQRAEALERLGEQGELKSAGPLVVSMIRDPSARVRKRAVAALGEMGLGPHLRQVIGRLNDPDMEVRLTAVRVLGDSRQKGARPALLLTLQDPSMIVRRAAGTALESLGMPPGEQVRQLAGEELKVQISRLQKSGDDQLRASAATMIGLSGQRQGLAPLISLAATNPPPLVVEAVAQAVGRIGGPDALGLLTRLSGSRAAGDRRAAALGLGLLASHDQHAMPPLTSLLSDPHRPAKLAALEALQAAGRPPTDEVRGTVCGLLSGEQLAVARGVGDPHSRAERSACAPPEVKGAPDLIARAAARWVRAEDCPEEVKRLCEQAAGGDVRALEGLGALKGPAVDRALLKLAQRSYEGYRHAAVRWVAGDRWAELDASPTSQPRQGGSPSGDRPASRPAAPSGDKAQALQRLLSRFPQRAREPMGDPLLPPAISDLTVVRAIQVLAGRKGTDGWLAMVATQAPQDVRVAALRVLAGGASQDVAVPELRLAFGSRIPVIRAAALAGCQRLGSQGLELALKGMNDVDFDVRAAAARCLGRQGDPRGLKPLLAALEQEQSLAALDALSRLGQHAATLPMLRLLQEDYAATRQDERVQLVRALGRLKDPAAVPALEREVSHPAWEVRRAAAIALSRVHRPATARALRLCLHDYYEVVRRACQSALERITQ